MGGDNNVNDMYSSNICLACVGWHIGVMAVTTVYGGGGWWDVDGLVDHCRRTENSTSESRVTLRLSDSVSGFNVLLSISFQLPLLRKEGSLSCRFQLSQCEFIQYLTNYKRMCVYTVGNSTKHGDEFHRVVGR